MKTTITYHEFANAFLSSDTYRNNFSRDGLIALFDYLEDLEHSTGEEMEFDMVAIACDFTEYASLAEFNESYGSEYKTWEDVYEVATVISVDDGAIVENIVCSC
jgi:hypothetical protein